MDFHDVFRRSKLRMYLTQEMSITLYRLSRKVVVDIGEKRVEFALSAFIKHVFVFLLKKAESILHKLTLIVSAFAGYKRK